MCCTALFTHLSLPRFECSFLTEGKKIVAKLENPFPSREGERSCARWLYLCTVVFILMLDMR